MLSLSKAADYSILVVGYLASLELQQVKTRDEIAALFNLPSDFLSKILQKLTRAGIVESMKGLRGGYRLQQPPDQITLGKIISIIDGPPHLVNCLREDFKDCGRTHFCRPIMEKLKVVEIELSSILENINFSELKPYIPGGDSSMSE